MHANVFMRLQSMGHPFWLKPKGLERPQFFSRDREWEEGMFAESTCLSATGTKQDAKAPCGYTEKEAKGSALQ